ncbi:LOW QUALITY PROTEIN: putative nuclease HARBI1 [Rhinophrynus dorsalis]
MRRVQEQRQKDRRAHEWEKRLVPGRIIRPRVFAARADLADLSDRDILKRFRLNQEAIMALYQQMANDLDPLTGRINSIPGLVKLLAFLHFLATGSFQSVSAVVIGMSQLSFSRCLSVLQVMPLVYEYISFPKQRPAWQELKEDFYRIAGMPNVLGAIDCKHVALRPPRRREEQYRNRKHFHSLNFQVVCDAKHRILSVREGFPGSCHDSHILHQSALFERFEEGFMPEGWLLGDSGYGCRSWLLTPLLNPQSPAELHYNGAHRSTCSVIGPL